MVLQEHNYCLLDLLDKWNIERLIWIAFYKNDKNNQCIIDKLPKDVVLFILTFLSLGSVCDVVYPQRCSPVYRV